MDGDDTPLLDSDASYEEDKKSEQQKDKDSIDLRNMVLFHGKVRG